MEMLPFCTCIANMTTGVYSLATYYPLNLGSRWHYTAPPRWGGDYIARIEAGPCLPIGDTVRHFDATNAAKVLCYLPLKGLYYLREEFSDGQSYVEFDRPILWFPDPLHIGTQVNITTSFTRYFQDGSTSPGTFTVWQTIADIEDVQVTAGSFEQCLRVEGGTHWMFDNGRQARSETIYHYAPYVGVVKAIARFILYDCEGLETVNRLVETDLKSVLVQGKSISGDGGTSHS
jgi:hypothetical protein